MQKRKFLIKGQFYVHPLIPFSFVFSQSSFLQQIVLCCTSKKNFSKWMAIVREKLECFAESFYLLFPAYKILKKCSSLEMCKGNSYIILINRHRIILFSYYHLLFNLVTEKVMPSWLLRQFFSVEKLKIYPFFRKNLAFLKYSEPGRNLTTSS